METGQKNERKRNFHMCGVVDISGGGSIGERNILT